MSGCYIKQEPYVDEYGIYVPVEEYVPEGCESMYRCVITKEMFVEAYNKWIKNDNTSKYDCLFNRQDELDNWLGDD